MLTGYNNDPLIAQLQLHSDVSDPDFWSFRNAAPRRGAHALLHYPAMMVPSLQGLILESILEVSPNTKSVLDPFVGSGTVLVESMERGLDFDGIDINPLAGLACLVKSGPYFVDSFDEKKDELASSILNDLRTHKAREFKGLTKWFKPDVIEGLAKIQFHIEKENSIWARRIFWLALCRVIRSSCNSRMSTYKLHIKPDNDSVIAANPCKLYIEALKSFSQYLREQKARLSSAGFLKGGRYVGRVGVEIRDNTISKSTTSNKKYDIVMTSPPYGDNATTIPYGQYAYLPLNWINYADIDSSINKSLFSNTHATDAASLGGSLRDANLKKDELVDKYISAKKFVDKLADNEGGVKRFVSFFSDIEKSVKEISKSTNNRGYQTWTIGNRRIGGMSVPMESLLQEMLERENLMLIGKIDRVIHKKKMASRNKSTETMSAESILLARKNDIQLQAQIK